MAKRKIETAVSPGHLKIWHGLFGPTRPNLRTFRIIGFDSEDDTRGQPISFTFYDGMVPYYTRHADEAIDYIYAYPDTAIFIAHNLEYDIGNLFKACNYRYIKDMVYASKLLKVSLIGTQHTFLNSSSFFAGPLKKMGDLLGIPKLEGDPLNPAYGIQDAKIPQRFGAEMQERLHNEGVNLGLSIGQMAMSIYRTNFIKKKVITYNSPNCLKAYYGGRVEMFHKGIVKGPIYVLDINSSYPTEMQKNTFPDTSLIEDSSIFTHEFGIGDFTVHVPANLFVPPLPHRSEGGRLFFPVGTFRGWWTYAEMRFAMEQGVEIVKEHAGEGTHRACRPFVEFIDEIYERRQAIKRRLEINPDDVTAQFENLFLKLEMNNLYGKFGQHKPGSRMTRIRLSQAELARMKGHVEYKRGPFYAYNIPREKPPKTANYLWGVYITSYARISLCDKMIKAHKAGATLLYCDTDSVMFKGEEALSTFKIGDGLGEMSKEVYDLSVFRSSKGYLLCNHTSNRLTDRLPEYSIKKVACKGVPTHLAYDFIIEGMATALKPMRLKEAQVRLYSERNLKKGDAFFKDIGVNVWRDVTKWMRSIYIKRQGDKGVTFPIDVKEIPELEKNASGVPYSIEHEIEGGVILKPEKKKDNFRDVKIPADWFDRKITEEKEFQYFASQSIHFLKHEELLELKTGERWFKGQILDMRRGPYGSYYVMGLIEFLGENVQKKNILAAVGENRLSIFGPDFVPRGKTVEFYLEKIYDSTSAPELRGRVVS